MKRLLKLYTMLQKNNRAGEAGKSAKSSAVMWAMLGVAAAIALGIACNKYADFVELLGGPFIIVFLVGIVVTVGVFGFGLFSLMTQMYMSSDIEVLITLPFSSIQIAVLRVLLFLKMAVLASLGVMLLPCIGYAMVYPLSVTAWIGIVVTAIAVPVFTTAFVAALVILLMRILKIFQSRETLRVIGTFFLFLLLCGYLYLTSNNQSIDVQGILLTMTEKGMDLKYIFPVIGLGLDFITKGNVLCLLGEILCTAAMVAVFLVIAKALYLQGAMSMQDAGRGKHLTEEDMDKYCTQKKVMDALVAKEYRLVRRNPTYMLYNFIVGALWPILVIVVFKQVVPMVMEGMEGNLSTIICGPISLNGFAVASVIFTLLALTMVSFPISMQTIAISSLSREGKSFMIMKQIPVAYDVQIEAKRRMARNVAQVSISGYSVLLMIAVAILLKFPVIYCVLPVLMVALYTEMQINANVALGIKNANVGWDDEKAAVQKPAGLVILNMVAMMAFLAGAITMIVILADDTMSTVLGLGVIACLAIVFYGIMMLFRRSIRKNGEKVIRRLRF